jgi:adenosyl cobinamide kinase/adenosyl cobinamide phosphate guanylyltransferase
VFDGIMGHDIEAFEKQFFEGSVLDQIDWLRGALIALDHKQFEQNVGYETDLIHIGKIADNIYRSSKQALVKSLAGIVYNMAYQYYHNPDAMNMRWGPRTEATTSSITQEIYKGHQVLDKMIFLNEELGKEDFLYQLSAEQVGVMDQAGTLQQIVCSHAAEQKLIEDGYMYGIMRDRIPLKQALKENRAYSPWPDTSAEDQLRLFRQFHRPEIQEVLTHQYGIPIRELRSHTQMQLFRILSQDNSVQTLERLGAIVEQHGVPYLDMLYLTADPRKRQDDVLENILSFAENQPADVVARASEYAYEFVSQVREVEQAIGKHAEESQIKNVPKTESVVRQMTKRLVRCVEQLSKSEKTLAPADVDALMAQVHKDAVFFASFFKELITSSSQDSIHIKDLYGVDLSDKPGTELTPEYKKAMIALYKKCWGNDGIKGEDLCNKYAAELESPPEGTTYYLLQKDNKLITSVKSIPVPEEGDRDVYIGSLITDPSYARASLAQAVSKLAVSAELKKGNIVHGAFSLDQKAGTSYVSDLGFVISRVDRVTLSDGTTYDRIHIMSSQALLDSLETKQDGWETNKGAQTRRFPADTPETEVIEEINSMLQQGYLGTQYAIDPNTGEKTFIFEQDPRTMKQAA